MREGGSAIAWLKAILESDKKQRALITVDPYGDLPYFWAGRGFSKTGYGEDFYKEAMKLLSNFAYDNRVYHTHFKLTSDDFMKIFDEISIYDEDKVLGKTFAFVYLDACKEQNTIAKEFEWFKKRMKSGGLIIFDDYDEIKNQEITNIVTQHILETGQPVGGRLIYRIS